MVGLLALASPRPPMRVNGPLHSPRPWGSRDSADPSSGLVNIPKTMERSTIFNGKTHYKIMAMISIYILYILIGGLEPEFYDFPLECHHPN